MFWNRKKKKDAQRLADSLNKVSIGIELGESEARLCVDFLRRLVGTLDDRDAKTARSQIKKLEDILASLPRIRQEIDAGFENYHRLSIELNDYQEFLEHLDHNYQILEGIQKEEGIYGFTFAGVPLEVMVKFEIGK
jgi:hypothetical protein